MTFDEFTTYYNDLIDRLKAGAVKKARSACREHLASTAVPAGPRAPPHACMPSAYVKCVPVPATWQGLEEEAHISALTHTPADEAAAFAALPALVAILRDETVATYAEVRADSIARTADGAVPAHHTSSCALIHSSTPPQIDCAPLNLKESPPDPSSGFASRGLIIDLAAPKQCLYTPWGAHPLKYALKFPGFPIPGDSTPKKLEKKAPQLATQKTSLTSSSLAGAHSQPHCLKPCIPSLHTGTELSFDVYYAAPQVSTRSSPRPSSSTWRGCRPACSC